MNNSRPPIEVQNSPALPAVMQIPFVPQLFNRKLTRKQIEETLAQLLESTKYLLMASQEAQPGIKIDDIPSSSDLKKMTSKERRQLRNKISARNFRVRRKEYIEQLESQVEQHKTEARHLREAVAVVHAENKRLREELEVAKRQSTQVTSSNVSDINAPQLPLVTPVPALSTENQVLLASIFSQSCLGSKDKVNATTNTLSRPHSSLLTPNLKKDMPNTPYIGDNAWKDANPISVHTAFVPEIVLKDQPFLRQGSLCLKEDELWNRPWLENERTPKELSKVDKNPFLVTSVVYELMQTLACEWLGAMNFLETQSVTCAFTLNEDKALVQDYEDGVHRIETINGETRCDKKMGAQMAFSRPQMCGMAVSELLEGFYRMLFGQKPPASCALDARWLFGLDLTFLFSLEVC
ncbi:hypothetical protein BCR41DRAFT_231561 [Lobosporangium transversale]|uniref:BZIP domain-containing protein n=1 Tax=Lobosporangium transversale TaxID=64571 RepID=A0A1Y2G8M5_9FUNG|nr:hypothetical protein BCR41DRAFT_231561 [Lobosporangium transversale]ORY97004.1 hypothetical protein BCR41DRAFT_231561 [Lobosporangium transversale]|eukprot:XP_021875566.1 hypothetical protein BCR41DRAFT_231561 [Lobosporangium transversale]